MSVAETLGRWLDSTTGARQEVAPAEGSRFRCSGALDCHRKRCLDALGVESSNPTSGLGLTALAVGDVFHQLLQEAMAAEHGDLFQAEVMVDLRPEHDLTGHCDGLLLDGGHATVFEFKTMAPYGFGLCVDGKRGTKGQRGEPPTGPKFEHLVQAGLYAYALEAATVALVYVDKGSGRIAEWSMGLTEESPKGIPALDGTTLLTEVTHELREIDELCDLLDAGRLPERFWPAGGLIHDPTSQRWPCSYCRHLETCSALPTVAVGNDFASLVR